MRTDEVELWGGVECTVNRVGDRYRDQLRLTGHHDRPDDLDLIAALGVKALRFPVLWERVAPDRPNAHDWDWSDRRLARTQALGMRPIIGLLHHGSGPRYTSLIADDFVAAFARYAAAVARRYPQVREWTPINEPLTTARFSCLYGTWYPHARDRGLFWQAVTNQAEATIAAMAAIRAVQPAARLVQTDDLGRSFADAAVQDVADYYNHRRWLFWDLLTGRVDRAHPLWAEGERLGFGDRLRAIAGRPCPPDVIGVNHYPTSDRFLRARAAAADAPVVERIEDLAAIRVLDPPPPGLQGALTEAWARYRLPLAVTECHLGCTREEQVRWLRRGWDTVRTLRADGVDIRGFTAWALMGNCDWVNLITAEVGHRESGAFDVGGARPRPTAVARLLTALPDAPDPVLHQIAAEPGWWERDARRQHPLVACAAAPARTAPLAPPILITGATGTLGRALAGACRLRGLHHVLTDRATLPIGDPAAIERVLDEVRPWAVVNAAGWVRVDDAQEAVEECYGANADGAAALAAACATRGIHYTMFSSDLVFGDRAGVGVGGGEPRDEDAPVAPLNVYGASKAVGESRVLRVLPGALVVRTAAFFSPFDEHNFAMHVERSLRRGEPVRASADHVVTPTYVPDLAKAVLDLVIDGEAGIWHIAHEEPVSWWTFGRQVAAALGLDPAGVTRATPAELGWRARRPVFAALTSKRGRLLPSLGQALAVHAMERRQTG